MGKTKCMTTSADVKASVPRAVPMLGRKRAAMSLVELLIGLSLGAVLLTAIATALQVMSSNLRTNQAQLMGMRAARVAMDYITTQLRQADECQIVTSDLVDKTKYGTDILRATHIKIIADGRVNARSDCGTKDYVEVHLQTVDLGDGRTVLDVWKDTGDDPLRWNGAKYTSVQKFRIPNITSAKILCKMVLVTPPDVYSLIETKAVSLQLTLDVADQHGQTVSIPMTSYVTVRRSGS